MDNDSLKDTQLTALETRLINMAPVLPPPEQQQLLYQCAFAAGQRAANRTLRRWRRATAVVTVLLIGAVIPLAGDRPSLARRRGEESAPDRPVMLSGVHEERAPIATRGSITLSLDAWQTKPSPFAALDVELAQFAQTDPHLRSLAVGALTRQILEQ